MKTKAELIGNGGGGGAAEELADADAAADAARIEMEAVV